MDTVSNKKEGSSEKNSSQKGRREDHRKRIAQSRTLKKSKDKKKSATRRDPKKTKKEKIILIKRSILDPVKERMLLAAEYISLIEMKKNLDKESEIIFLIQFLDLMYRQSNTYLSYILDKEINNGRDSELRVGCE